MIALFAITGAIVSSLLINKNAQALENKNQVTAIKRAILADVDTILTSLSNQHEEQTLERKLDVKSDRSKYGFQTSINTLIPKIAILEKRLSSEIMQTYKCLEATNSALAENYSAAANDNPSNVVSFKSSNSTDRQQELLFELQTKFKILREKLRDRG